MWRRALVASCLAALGATAAAAVETGLSIEAWGDAYGHGDPALQVTAKTPALCESLDVCGTQRFVCVAQSSGFDKLNQTYAQIKAVLEQAMVDADAQTGGAPHFAPLTPLVRCR